MRLCVRWLHVCAGEEKRSLRKSALWGRALTEKRILGAGPHGKAHSGGGPSRKSAFWGRALTERRTLGAGPHGKAHSARPPACRLRPLVKPTRKVRLSVRAAPQSASLRESPGAEWGTCARCCDAIRQGVNPHEPPKSLICEWLSMPSDLGVSVQRSLLRELIRWKSRLNRKPLIVQGGALDGQDMAHERVCQAGVSRLCEDRLPL